MNVDALITVAVIVVALILFATEWLKIDLVALLIIGVLVLTGVVSPEEGVSGFSNKATITVMFMFVMSAALMKTGALELVSNIISGFYRRNFLLGTAMLMITVAACSAFINNTPVVAVFIPIAAQIAKASGVSPAKLLIPVSFASIFGGTCTLIGTSTNIVVSGIAEKLGVGAIGMFDITYMGLIFLSVGILYMLFIGMKLLPSSMEENLADSLRKYIMQFKVSPGSSWANKRLLEIGTGVHGVDVMAVWRNERTYTMPGGDFKLEQDDILTLHGGFDKVNQLKNHLQILDSQAINQENQFSRNNTTMVELVVLANSDIDGKKLKDVDFRNRFRAIPLAIKHKEDIVREGLYDYTIKAGDVIVAEVKRHYVKELKKMEVKNDAIFALLTQTDLSYFSKKKFIFASLIILTIVVLSSIGIVDIMVGTICGTCLLVLAKQITMKEIYNAINWDVIFLLAGALSLGLAMSNSGLDMAIGKWVNDYLGQFGPIAVVSGLYLITSLLTEIMSNNASAAILTPIAISIAHGFGLSPLPFIMSILFAASASFMTPVGYQTNSMVFAAGGYKFKDFFKVGWPLNLLFWIVASLLIPVLFPF